MPEHIGNDKWLVKLLFLVRYKPILQYNMHLCLLRVVLLSVSIFYKLFYLKYMSSC